MTLRSNSAAARDVAHHLHPFTNAARHEADGPLVMSGGQGVHVRDSQGRDYIEGMSGLWCTSLGYNEPRLVRAATKQLEILPFYHNFSHMAADVTIELADRLVALAPVPMSKAFFTNSGSEANDTVVKLVWYLNNALGRPKKKKIIAQLKGYHGSTVAAASLCGLPNSHRDFDLPIANILHSGCPHHYRFGAPGESEEDFAARMAEALDALIEREGPDTVAAFIAEPVQGSGGVIVPPRTYFEKVQAVLRRHDVLFIADEVITGFCRTGNFWGSQTFQLTPDIMTMAKALSSAYLPIGAVLINQKVYEAVRDNSGKIGVFGHGFTYSGHPVSAAVALEALAIYEERDILGHVRRVGPLLQQGLRRLGDHPLVGEVRGVGLMGALELVRDRKTRQPFDPAHAVGAQAVRFARQHGLIVRTLGDSVALSPPLIIDEAEIAELLARFGRALDDTLAWVRNEGIGLAA
jgi:4-aminobutyrate---pyruvate transaminase